MLEYVENIIAPYIERVRESFESNTSALVIMDNFKGQITESVLSLLDQHNIHVCLLPPNTTDRLQPMDISVNKPAKDHLRSQFNEWYTQQVVAQLDGEDVENLEDVELQTINLGMPAMKELGAKWLVNAAQYISDNPHIIVNGFVRSGIAGALDGQETDTDDQSGDDQDIELDSDYDSDDSEED